MSVIDNDLLKRWRGLTVDLRALEAVFPDSQSGITARHWFDEFLSQNELQLALLVACDFLLEPDARAISPATFAQIQDLYSRMGITDACMTRLNQKMLGPPAS